MIRDINDFVAGSNSLQFLEMIDRNAIIDAVPETRQQPLQNANDRIRIVGSDFIGILSRAFSGFCQRNTLLFRFFADSLPYGTRFEQLIDERAAVR